MAGNFFSIELPDFITRNIGLQVLYNENTFPKNEYFYKAVTVNNLCVKICQNM